MFRDNCVEDGLTSCLPPLAGRGGADYVTGMQRIAVIYGVCYNQQNKLFGEQRGDSAPALTRRHRRRRTGFNWIPV